MKIANGQIIYSPSDLVVFFQSPYISWCMHRNQLVPKDQRLQKAPNATMDMLSAKGDHFERAELKKMAGQVVEIPRGKDITMGQSLAATVAAMRAGADVIYQGALRLGDFEGYTDFMKKVPGRKSNLGDYSYEIYDTKLAHTAKPTHAIQISAYNEMLREILGDWPQRWHLILGNGKTESFLTSDFRYYYAHFKKNFQAFHAAFDIDQPPTPESWETAIGYEEHIAAKLKAMDHLVTVAGMSGAQIGRLHKAGVRTRAELAAMDESSRPKEMRKDIFEKLREQAALQIKSEAEGLLAYRVLDHKAGAVYGLARLPAADDGDVMFDMEGDPFAEGGLEYLFGVYIKQKGQWIYKDWRAVEPAEEKSAFTGFIDWLMAHYKKNPRMHVYHYANYERAAISNLSNKHSCRIAEVDTLLRNEVFVDLYKVIKEGLRVGAESYSIKKLEPLYGFKRASSVTNAGDSVVQFGQYCELRNADPQAAEKIFSEIVDYNREDVVSTLELLEWLRSRKSENKIQFVPAEEPNDQLQEDKDWELTTTELLTDPPKWIETAEQKRVNQVVAGMSGYFQREDRPIYWNFYNRQDTQPEELYLDAECLAVASVKSREGNVARISFDPEQPLKLKVGDEFVLHGSPKPFANIKITKLDLVSGLAQITLPRNAEVGPDITLVPGGPIPTRAQKIILGQMAQDWREKGESALTPAALDILYRRPPRVKGIERGTELYKDSETALQAALRIARGLDQSALSIQGPPGSGKTFTGANLICHLVNEGKRVAVVAQGKKTIENLLLAVCEQWSELKMPGRCPAILMSDSSLGGENPRPQFKYMKNTGARAEHRQFKVVGGTHWLFAHEDMSGAPFDYLFIDEAGQFSLTTAIACSYCAKNIILLGDQMQLEQVNVGVHPDDSGLSVLNYFMNGQATVPRTHGVFLDQTWRMHPDICGFISELIYESRLTANTRTSAHTLSLSEHTDESLAASGILFLEVDHEGNSMSSREEAEMISELVDQLSFVSVPDGLGGWRAFTGKEEDLIVITPYNAQVELIRSRLPAVKVGSVDLFQGQEAWVSVLSMCASGEEGLHRGLDFLLSKNRMNVGLSRAKALSVVVGSRKLLDIRPWSIRSIPLLNFYAGLVGRVRSGLEP